MIDQPRFPKAVWKPLDPSHYITKDLIVLHVTSGPSASSAYNTFSASVHPNRTSVHFCIDRDGTVFQYAPLYSTTWHASQVNERSIGIEHAAMVNGTLPITPAQLESSAELVLWLTQTLGIPLDRDHVKSHNEASPNDHHTLCCAPTLDPDDVVKLALDKLSKG